MDASVGIGNVEIEDTFAEAFDMVYSRILVTAENEHWLNAACLASTGFATSVIGCGVEAGVEGLTDDTPDGRPGAYLLFFTMGKKGLEKHLIGRIGQALMTCPTTAVFNATDSDSRFDTGSSLRYFGDGHQASKVIGDRRYWRIPVMEGEFVVEESFGWRKGIGGGNFLILAGSQDAALKASQTAVEAIASLPGVILPFPGGVVRSGSKIGSRYKFLSASTNTEYCPTIRRQTDSSLKAEVNCVLEIVIDGVDENAIKNAMKSGITSACKVDGVLAISAGNYGGKLGSFHFYLHKII
ncbi:Formylmethanofuran--tetrahydromethanopterin N-formyltransferase [hydrothermal vent metagenome]|uniref:Formylmethanofuran--tetrahydromethanopterin N-formyltransferase n=1 Tax=hydrothermal vent metagenome TaxID=652676 RepID=A0A3B1BZF5_9ZZZZ